MKCILRLSVFLLGLFFIESSVSSTKLVTKDDYIRNKKLPNVSILMSSSNNEFSYVDTLNNMGFFAKAIEDGFRGYADAEDMNYIISLRELVDNIKKVLPQRTRNCQYCRDQQTPQILNEGKSFNTRLSN